MAYPYFDKVIRHLWSCTGGQLDQYVYAILDAARNEKIYPALSGSDIEYRCLYEGDIPQVLAEAAPYLVRFRPGSSFLEWLVKEGWGDSWGIFLTSAARFKDLVPHFREFIMASDEDGNEFYFRFYDPRVFRVYLPTCNESELSMIFGPVDRYFGEEADGKGIIEFSFHGSALVKKYVELEMPNEESEKEIV